jgi:hypothetical protein
MTDVADIMQRLHALTVEDRAWILGKLPATAKSALLAAAAGEPSPPPSAPTVEDAPVLPTTLAPRSVAAALKEEAAWVAVALLEDADESWIAEVIAHLPPVLRSDIDSMRRAGASLTILARRTLIRLLLAKIGEAAPQPAPSKFQVLLDRLSASRSRKRMTLHL